ncbi:unnamed protein product [Cyberlindnera jadinii]|uniref:Large ribosomal subunit protein bL21m n=2 Tax=Cyberlindnera jadinii (strain ATCC 18201 / CBS 1600 / BCRC 20928 / JCM 3617 / NBRC 0987 / NRRL Y-1542) TaxID=983966 RepID=A0A0H5C354_CYBJN|nr:unnamed protein product [Cyberlindnera jadinii]
MSFTRPLARSLVAQLRAPSFAVQKVSPVVPFMMASRAFSTHLPLFQQQKPQDGAVPDLTPLKLEGDLYAVVKVHNNPFLVTKGDKMVLPFNLKTAEVGDVLNFHNVTTIGSRNYTFVDEPISPELFTIKATVLEKTKLPMRVTEKTKRRQRIVKHAISKPHRTILRVTELKLN